MNLDEYFVSDDNIFNVWQIQNKRWLLLLNSEGAPLEFDKSGAEKYIETNEMKKWEFVESPGKDVNLEGLTFIRKAPKQPSNIFNMRMTLDQANDIIKKSREEIAPAVIDDSICDTLRKLFMSNDGGEQAMIWQAALVDNKQKPELLKLSNSTLFKNIVRGIFYGDTYQVIMAKLEVFQRHRL